MHYKFFILLLSLVLVGCQSTPSSEKTSLQNPLTLVNTSLFAPVERYNVDEIFQLSHAQKQEFFEYYQKQKAKEFPSSNERIIHNFLDDKLTGFTFHGDTLDAYSAFSQKRGNCISLAVFTTALADLIQTPIDYQLVINEPVYFKKGNLILSSSHLRSRVYDADNSASKNKVFFVPKSIVIDYFPTRGQVHAKKAQRPQLIAKFYANLAAETLLKNDFDATFSYLYNAMLHDPFNSELINLQAVLHRRAGDTTTANRLYHYAVTNNLASINLYQNYMLIARNNKDEALIAQLNAQLAHIKDPNPYSWLELGKQAIADHDLHYAQFYFNKAVKAAHYIPEPYIELAKIAYQNGDLDHANQYLEAAIERTYDHNQLAIYQAKYQALKTITSD